MKNYYVANVPIEKVHKQLFLLLKEFDRVCKKHGINYTLEGGTLLGAVKYGDFVPWDDDLDVVMLREDYDKFVSACKTDLSDGFFLQNTDTDKNFPLSYSKLRLNGTKYVQANYEFLDIHHGLFLDIVPYDYANPKTYKKKIKRLAVLNGARQIKLGLVNSKTNRERKISRLKKFVYKIVSVRSLGYINKKIQKLLRGKTSGYLYNFTNPIKSVKPISIDRFKNYTELDFRGEKFLAVSDYNNWLKETFGDDFMSNEPSVEIRGPSHAICECKLLAEEGDKRVGILTFHQADNYGAVLQAYALSHAIDKLGNENGKNVNCEVVDYENSAIKNRYVVKPLSSYKRVRTKLKYFFINRYRRRNNHDFKLFRDAFLKVGSKTYSENEIAKANNDYDVFVTGSDQIWNGALTNNDKNYFLRFASEDKAKVAYAASVGSIKLYDNSYSSDKPLIDRLDAVSARELDLYEYLVNNGVEDVVQVCDPAFLLNADEYKYISLKKPVVKGKYVLVYVIGSPYTDKLKEFSQKIAREKGAKVVYINTDKLARLGVKNLRNVPVQAFLRLIKDAEAVITSSFHGFAYSLIFNTDVYFKLAGGEINFNSRIESLAKIAGVSNRNVDGSGFTDIDWDSVNLKISEIKEKSLKFLSENVINGKQQ